MIQFMLCSPITCITQRPRFEPEGLLDVRLWAEVLPQTFMMFPFSSVANSYHFLHNLSIQGIFGVFYDTSRSSVANNSRIGQFSFGLAVLATSTVPTDSPPNPKPKGDVSGNHQGWFSVCLLVCLFVYWILQGSEHAQLYDYLN